MNNEYRYTDPKTLNILTMLVKEKDSELSATLMPDILEFIDAVNYIDNSEPSDLEQKLDIDVSLLRSVKKTINILGLCEKHNIMPFLSLVFNYIFQFRPSIEYVWCEGNSVNDEPYNSCVHPIHFTKGNKWYSIRFKEVAGKESVGKAKLAIANFIEQGYIVTSLHAALDPWIKSSEYMDEARSSASFYAEDGKINVYGDIPKDFEDFVKNLSKGELPEPKKQLPKPIFDAIKILRDYLHLDN